MGIFFTGLVAGAFISLVLSRIFVGHRPLPSHLQHLNRIDVTIIQAVGDVMFPEGGDLTPSARDAEIVTYLDNYFSWHSPTLRTLMHLMFLLIEHGTILFVPTWTRMSNLGIDERIAYLATWEKSRFYLRRMVFLSLRAVMCMAYLAAPDVERAMGMYRPQNCIDNAIIQ